jgi:hypothetical protein
MRASLVRISACAAVLLLAGSADAQMMSGQVLWTSTDGATHPCRGIEVQVWAARSAGDIFVGTATTDLDGHWTSSFPFPGPTTIGYFAFAVAHTAGGRVVPVGGGEGSTYRVDAGFVPGPAGGITPPVTIGYGSDAERAFSITDALFTSHFFATHMTSTPLTERFVQFPGPTPGGSAYNDTTGRITLGSLRWQYWDVINHEYAHYLEHADALADAPGGYAHSVGTNLIAVHGKNIGARLAWSEGLATYHGLMSQRYLAGDQHLTPYGDVGDANYDNSGPTETVESMDSGPGKGEGDERSVARILWDLTDVHDAAEPWDRVDFAVPYIYSVINSQAAPDRLNNLWTGLTTAPGTSNAVRADIGAVFGHNGVSPMVTSPLDGRTIDLSDPPTITFQKGNDGFNDRFGLMVFSADMTTLVAEFAEFSVDIPGATATFDTSLEWSALLRLYVEAHGGSATLKFVLWGRDTRGPGAPGTGPEVDYAGTDITGDYWSEAYTVVVTGPVPAPGACVMLGVLAARPRRRRA